MVSALSLPHVVASAEAVELGMRAIDNLADDDSNRAELGVCESCEGANWVA